MLKTGSILLMVAAILTSCCTGGRKPEMVKRVNHQFFIGDKPYYFVGTNYWYGAILASAGQGGNRDRLIRELDLMKNLGINNLRVLAGAEGPNNQPYRVTPALQMAPGVYNDTIFDGLDFLLTEMGKRQMYAVLYLHNSWEWSGGYAQYLNWNGYGDIPYPQIPPHSWPEFMSFVSQFHACDSCRQQFKNHISTVLNHVNRYTGKSYKDDPTIMTWEIANEPRAFSDENKPRFAQWVSETAAYIKSIDPNHLVTTGTEGRHGCEKDMELFKTIHADANIDYLTMHIWPKNWSWLNCEDIGGTIDTSIVLTRKYIDDHMAVARQLDKPIVFEEFGLPRDHHRYDKDDSTVARDLFYQSAFQMVEASMKAGDVLAGSNFWAFTGYGRHTGENPYWKPGDDLMGDPPQEQQGLNSVFDTDSTTLNLIRKHAGSLGCL